MALRFFIKKFSQTNFVIKDNFRQVLIERSRLFPVNNNWENKGFFKKKKNNDWESHKFREVIINSSAGIFKSSRPDLFYIKGVHKIHRKITVSESIF